MPPAGEPPRKMLDRETNRGELPRLPRGARVAGLIAGAVVFGGLPLEGAVTVVLPRGAPAIQWLAAREVRRYVFLRTGEVPVIGEAVTPGERAIVLETDPNLGAGAFSLSSDGPVTRIVGGDDQGVLYGAYRYAEKTGVRFDLRGDVVPDERLREWPVVNETGRPLFALRGVNPWGSHPFGIDAWSADDYKAVITQLAKLRMNFLGVHCYPEGHPYAEPTVWHGLPDDVEAEGKVRESYPTRYYNTLLTPAWGNYRPRKTGEYGFGGAQLFDDDAWTPEVFRGHGPLPATAADCNAVFNRMGAQFNDAFTFARRIGVKTCVGTEAPLTIPAAVVRRVAHVKQAHPARVRQVYEGTFRRIMACHPLDYYWIWTPEGWTWQDNDREQYAATAEDIRLAIEARRNVNAPFRIATAGWVLGPAHDRAAFDHDMPADIPLSAISRDLGATEVDPAFARISGREKWAIPWLESDGRQGLAGLQLWAGRMRRDAFDARRHGCTGLMGLHWRTEILAPNISALAQAAWDQGWERGMATADLQAGQPLPRSLPTDDFYADWAQANFGLTEAGKVFAALDGKVPQVCGDGCPAGDLSPVATPWAAIAPQFSFVDEFERLREQVRGPGNLARFDFWSHTFCHLRSLARLRCALATGEAREITEHYATAYRHLLATVNSPGALAMVVNMENHPGWGPAIAAQVRQPWPQAYSGPPRLIVPTVRSVATKGESITLKIIALAAAPVDAVTVRWRPLGRGEWRTVAAKHQARSTWVAELPAATEDFEYHIISGDLIWPVTAPQMNQTVVVLE